MKNSGFTLVEIMIVVAIIALLTGIAVPNLLRARFSAQEAALISLMRTIHGAETEWRVTHSTYGSWDDLRNAVPPYIPPSVPYDHPYDYNFSILGIEQFNKYFACANKLNMQGYSFYIDEAGVLCKSAAVGDNCSYAQHMGGQCDGAWQNLQ
ncbi:MAG: prepilin-type N-terminal cleavage/methylation domain-containing protein [Candidatus Omnitrophica bacterium]|nr:prepilin-type N-terminal cleavage/methylation domain-containing protein [Candidatus Omnitrophota bacterium]